MFLSKQAVKTQREDSEDKHAHITMSLPDSNTHCSEQKKTAVDILTHVSMSTAHTNILTALINFPGSN